MFNLGLILLQGWKKKKYGPTKPTQPAKWAPHSHVAQSPCASSADTQTSPGRLLSTRTMRGSRAPAAPMGAFLPPSPARKCALPTRPTAGPRAALQPITTHLSARQWVHQQLPWPFTTRHVAQLSPNSVNASNSSPISTCHVSGPLQSLESVGDTWPFRAQLLLSVEFLSKLRICPINCQKSPKII